MAEGVTVEQGTAAIERAIARLGMPEDIIAKMAGTADAFAATQKSQPFMILGALLAVYLVLGVLYESYIHPLTILRSEEHTSELQSLMRISYAVFCLKKKKIKTHK